MNLEYPESRDLRAAAIQIWAAGISAVAPESCIRRHVLAARNQLQILPSLGEGEHAGQNETDSAAQVELKNAGRHVPGAGQRDGREAPAPSSTLNIPPGRRVIVVGGGKAVVGMAQVLVDRLREAGVSPNAIEGLLSVPEGAEMEVDVGAWPIEVCPTRPKNQNAPTEACVAATRRIQRLLDDAPRSALVMALVSGGASALLCAPPRGVSLQQKRQLFENMSRSGLAIQQINTVRQHVSDVKGGRLAMRFRGDDLVTFILSDVLGDRLEWIGSGPTVPPTTSPADALTIVHQLVNRGVDVPRSIVQALKQRPAGSSHPWPRNLSHVLVGNLSLAVDAAARCANGQGRQVEKDQQSDPWETVDRAAENMVDWLVRRSQSGRQHALVSGGEPVVHVRGSGGKGGRNTHLALAALKHIVDRAREGACGHLLERPFVLVAASSDGEDGTAEACGAMIDHLIVRNVLETGKDPTRYLQRFDSRSFFDLLNDGLIEHSPAPVTNVCDLRVAMVG